MPKRRYEQREPTHDWQQIRPLLKDSAQITYEVIRPVILGWETPKERSAETGMPMSSIYYKANLFDQAGMASLLPPAPPPEIPKQDKRSLPPHIRQEIVDLHTQYPAFRPHEIATICFVKFNRKPAPATIKLILASGPKPSTTERRHPRYAEIESGKERRRLVIRLHADGWNAKSIAGYLDVSRKTVHEILRRFAEEQFAGLEDKSHARKGLRKVDIQTIQEIKKLSENPLLGAYRVSAALEQMGIKLSRATCGRYLSINRSLYHLQMPRRPRPKANMPFRAERRHQIWSVDIRYLDMHSLQGIEMVYCISILENFSRSILASAISVRQDTEAFFAVLYVIYNLERSGRLVNNLHYVYSELVSDVLFQRSRARLYIIYAAVRRYGVPEILVSDNGSVFISHDTRRVCAQLGIEKREIKKGRPYQNYIEAAFGVQRRMADWSFEKAQTWEDLLAAHNKWMRDYNFQKHMAHEERQDGCHSPAEVLGWVKGMQPESALVHQAFSAICETRRLDKAGYAKFRNWSLYGRRARSSGS
jgi:putative transposase